MVNNLKNILLGVLLVLVAQKGSAQENKDVDDFNTIFQNFGGKIGVYGGPLIEYSRFIGQNTFFVGGKGGLLINRKWGIGLLGKGIVTSHIVEKTYKDKKEKMKISSGFGGIFVEHMWSVEKTIHFNFFTNFLMGRSRAYLKKELDAYEKSTRKISTQKSDHIASATLLGIEPGIGMELNITHFLIINLYFSYRYIEQSQPILDFKNKDFSDFTTGLNLKFGYF